MACDCRAVFNSLSSRDRKKLKTAAFFKAVTGFISDETEKYPERYPFYAAYLLLVATPFPMLGVGLATLGATGLWVKGSRSPLAVRLKSKLNESFDQARLVCAHKDYIVPANDPKKSYKVKNTTLSWHTTRHLLKDVKTATKHAYKAAQSHW